MFAAQSGCVSLGGRYSGTSHTQPGGMWCLLLPGTGENVTGLHVDKEIYIDRTITSTTRMHSSAQL